MKNRILKIGGGILIVLVVVFLGISLSLDGMIKSSIEETSSDMLQVEVDVDDVAISLFDGRGTIDGLMIQNPKGFADRPAIQFKQIKLKIDLATLLSDTIVVNNLLIQNPSVYVEQTTEGNNLTTLQDRLGSSSGESYNTYMVIDHLLINESHVQLKSTIGEERNVEATITKIELTDVGRSGNNTIKQTTRQILEPVLKKAIRQAAKQGIKDLVKDKVQDLLGG